MIRKQILPIVILTLAFGVTGISAQEPEKAAYGYGSAMVEVSGKTLAWAPIQPPGFDAGMRIAVLSGDPGAAGQPYVLRLAFPAGYRFPSHWHPATENLTVVEGEFLLQMDMPGATMKTYRPGDFLFIPPGNAHLGGADVETVIQLHGVAPFEIILTSERKP